MSKLDHAASLTSSDAASTRKATLQQRITNTKSINTGYNVLFLRRKVARFREDSTFSTWVTRIAINEALMLLRQRRPNTPLLEGNGDGGDAHSVFDLTDKGPTPEEILAEKELRDTV